MKYLIIWVFCYLQAKPELGITAGVSGSGIYAMQHNFLTDDALMKIVSNFGICCSSVVAFLSALAWVIKYYRAWRKERNTQD